MHEQITIQARGIGAEPNYAAREAILSSLEGRGRAPRLAMAEQNTQSLIDAVLSWLAGRERVQASQE